MEDIKLSEIEKAIINSGYEIREKVTEKDNRIVFFNPNNSEVSFILMPLTWMTELTRIETFQLQIEYSSFNSDSTIAVFQRISEAVVIDFIKGLKSVKDSDMEILTKASEKSQKIFRTIAANIDKIGKSFDDNFIPEDFTNLDELDTKLVEVIEHADISGEDKELLLFDIEITRKFLADVISKIQEQKKN